MTIATNPANAFPLSGTIVAFNSPWRWAVPLFAMVALIVLLVSGENVGLFYFINRITSSANDGLWIHLSLLGDGLLVILFVLPFIGRRPDVVWQYILAWLFAGIFVPGMKALFSSLRPPASLSLDSFHLIGPALQNNAFPSGHTTAIFVLAGLVCLQRTDALGKFGVWIKFLALLLAVFVGLSRIANGVHWPVDVLGAAIGGWIVAMAAVWLAQYWRGGMNVWAQRVFALILTPASLWAVWSLWYNHADVYPGTAVMKVLLLVVCLALSIPGQLRLFNFRK
jgi:membrane-associated phospholipid phosphatase